MQRLTCGVCGGGVRLYEGTLHGRPITDWKHTDVPPGTAPHRPVLGTPVDQETLDRLHAKKEEPVAIAPPLTIETEVINRSDMPKGAQDMLALAEDYGWKMRQKALLTKIGPSRRTVAFHARRNDLGFVAWWKFEKNKWGFDWAFLTVGGRPRAEQVGSNSLKDWIKQPVVMCPACSRSEIAADHEECA